MTKDCVDAIPDKYGHVPFDACNSNYAFNPNFAANLVFTVLFGLTTLAHLVQAVVFVKPYCWVLIMGGVWETTAFVLRTFGSHHQQNESVSICGQLFFLLAPLWINAFAYMTVARMIHFGLPDKKIWGIRAVKLTVIFVWLDVICFLVQAAGGVMLSGDDEKVKSLGMKIYTAGIGVQLGFIVIFGIMTVWFYRLAYQVTNGRLGRLQYLIWVLITVLLLIVVRVVFRLVEFGPGLNSSNQLITNEAYPLGLDAMPMVLALVLLNVMHPGLVLRGPDGEFPKKTRAEKKAIKQAKKEAKQAKKEERKMMARAKKDAKQLKEGKRGGSAEGFVMMDLETGSDDGSRYFGTR